MSDYFQWTEDLSERGEPVIQLLRLELENLAEWDLALGKTIDNWSDENVVYCDEIGAASDLFCTTMQVHVVSKRLCELLQSMDLRGVQYLPLKIFHEAEALHLDAYYVPNVDHVVDCLDLRRSKYNMRGDERRDRRPDNLRDLRRAALSREKIGGELIFRLARWKAYLIVEE